MKQTWSVELTAEAEKELRADFKAGKLTVEDIKVMTRWIADVEEQGLEFTQHKSDWRDHELADEWKSLDCGPFRFRTQIE